LLGKRGVLLAGEVTSLLPPDAQVTLIIPDAGGDARSFFSTVRLLVALSGGEIKDQTIADRKVQYSTGDLTGLAWWQEGTHAVLVAGLQPPEKVVKRMQSQKTRLTNHALYKKVQSFN